MQTEKAKRIKKLTWISICLAYKISILHGCAGELAMREFLLNRYLTLRRHAGHDQSVYLEKPRRLCSSHDQVSDTTRIDHLAEYVSLQLLSIDRSIV